MNVFAALADPTRLRIFELIARGEKTVGEIVQAFSFKPSTISQHLQILKQAKLASIRAEDVFLYHNGADSYYAVRGFRGSLRVLSA